MHRSAPAVRVSPFLPGLLLGLTFLGPGTARAQETVQEVVAGFAKQLETPGVDREKLRRDILAFVRRQAGSSAAAEASAMLARLPSPLDQLDPKQIPELDRFDWQPKELVAVIGEHRGRHGSPVTCLEYGKDGKVIVSGGTNGLVRIWDSATLRLRAVVSTGHHTSCVALSEDGKTLAAGTVHGGLFVWDISGDQPVRTGHFKAGSSRIYGLDFSKDGTLLAAGVFDGYVHVLDLEGSKPKERTQLSGHKTPARAVRFAPNSRTLAAAGNDGSIRFWTFQGDRTFETGTVEAHTAAISCLAFNNNGTTLVAGCDDGHIARVTIGARLTRGPAFKSPAAITAIGYSSTGYLTTSHSDGEVRLWSTATPPRLLGVVEGHVGSAEGFGFSPDGRTIATGGSDWTVRLWGVAVRASERFPLKGPWARVHDSDFSPDGDSLACASEDRTARIWLLDKPAPVQNAQLGKDNTPVYAVAHSPDGKTLATGGHGTVIRLWDLTRRNEIRTYSGHPTHVTQIIFTPDGQRLLASSGKTVVLWSAATAREILRFDGHAERVNTMSMSSDGRYVLTGTGYYRREPGTGKLITSMGEYLYDDCTIRLWDVREGGLKQEVTNLERPVNRLAFAPNGRSFACSMWHRPATLWEASPLELKKQGDLQNSSVWAHLLAFSPDGKRLASVGQDHKLRLTDLATDRIIREWTFAESIAHLVFSPDSRYLAASLQTGPVYILRLDDAPASAAEKGSTP